MNSKTFCAGMSYCGSVTRMSLFLFITLSVSFAAQASTLETSETPAPGLQNAVTAGAIESTFKLPGCDTSLGLGGFVKVDAIYSDYGAAAPVGDDLFVPSLIPLEDTADDRRHDFSMHAKSSRLWFKSHTPTEFGEVTTRIEMDFMISDQGNEQVSNSYALRVRHAYASLGNWLFGQTWTNFMILETIPDIFNFGLPVANPVIRQTQLRYSKPFPDGSFHVALENPEVILTDSQGARVVPADDRWPDISGRYIVKGKAHTTGATLLVRNLRVNTEDQDEDTWVYAVTLGGKFILAGKDNLKWLAGYGAMGRYASFNLFNDGTLSDEGKVEGTDMLALYVAYQHWWNAQWRSSWALGYGSADTRPEVTGDGVNKTFWSSHLNLMWSPTPSTKLGVEYIHANREVENGQEGALNRIQFSGIFFF